MGGLTSYLSSLFYSSPARGVRPPYVSALVLLCRFPRRSHEEVQSSTLAPIGVIYNSILIIINRLIKYTHFIFYKKELIVEDLIYAFNRNVIANHGILKEIISNKDKLFISKF
jgi:hypothetical protein